MANNVTTRVHYFPQQVLRTQDFQDEQAYHLAAHRRHNISHHLWGIVQGLEIVQDKDQNLSVTPGFAVDGYGRDVALPAAQPVPASAFDEKLAESLDVWAVYRRTPGDRGAAGYQPCVDAVARLPYRWDEAGAIEWSRSEERLLPDPVTGIPECRRPPGVSDADVPFEPFKTPPDDPARRWPVFLGRVARVRAEGKVSYVIDPGGRPYAGARAEAIVAPSGEAQVQIGTACGQNAYRFAVFVDSSTQGPAAPSPRLALDEDGAWVLRGDTAVAGSVTIDGGALVFGQGEPYAAPRPWRIYRVADVEERVIDEETVEVAIDELRIEVAERPAGSSDVANQVAIGVWSAQDQKFKPSLTVSDDGTVTIHGDLIVEGNLNPRTRIEAELSAESAALVVGAAMSGAMGFQGVLRNAAPPSGPIEGPRLQSGGRTKSSAKSAAPPETENGGGTDPEG